MLFCQQCGAGNSDDARFCNQCGGRIASPGEPGGPLPLAEPEPKSDTTLQGHGRTAAREAPPEEPLDERPAPVERRSLPGRHEPSQGFDVSTMSLSAIGVRSRGKAWGVLIASVIALVGLGALGMWFLMNVEREPAPIAEVDPPLPPDVVPPDEVEIGDPLPEGSEPPVDFVPGTPRPSRSTRAPSKQRGTSGTRSPATPRRSGGSSSGSSGSGATGGSTSGGSGGSGGSTGSGASTGSGGSESETGTGGSTGSGSSGGSTPPDTIPDEPDWEAMEEEDSEMDEYAARVRSVIRQYYMRRAQGCFERETRNEQSVRGTVVIGFDIQEDGNIENAEVARNTTGLDTLGRCLAAQVDSWRLPPPPESPLPMQMPFSR